MKKLFILLALIIPLSLHAKTVTLTEHFCEPTRLLLGCEVLDATGTYDVEVTPDSIVHVALTIGSVSETDINVSIDQGERFLIGCETLTEEGTHPVTLTSAAGCDSIVNVHLSYTSCDTAYSTLTRELCPSDIPYIYSGAREYTIAGDTVILDTIFGGAANGCDSIATITFRVNIIPETDINVSINEGERFLIGCETLTEEGIHPVTLTSAAGCDSVVNVHLSYTSCDTAYSTLTRELCPSDIPYIYIGAREYTIMGDTVILDTIFGGAANGCDSIATITFRVNIIPETDIEVSINKGERFLIGCETLTEEGIHPVTLTSAAGCDSVVNVHLSFTSCDTAYSTLTRELCPSDIPYIYSGAREYTITSDTVINDTIFGGAANGCDSIATITFRVNRIIETLAEEMTICPGSSFEWRGQVCNEAKTYYDTIRYASGCDSGLYSMEVRFHEIPVSSRTMVLCENELPYVYEGAGIYVIHGETTISDTIFGGAATGCDSVDVITFIINRPKPMVVADTTICPGDIILWRNHLRWEEKTYYDTLRYASGCDSIIYALTIHYHEVPRVEVFETLCLAEAKAKYAQFSVEHSGTWIDTLRSAVYCDSIVTYHLTVLTPPEAVDLAAYADYLPHVVCGMPLDTKALLSALEPVISEPNARYVQTDNTLLFEGRDGDGSPISAAIVSLWLEVEMSAGRFVRVDDTFKPFGQESINLRVAMLTECNKMIYSRPVAFEVEMPSPDNTSAVDNLPAVSKYNDWLLMIDNRVITDMGYRFDEDDVTWYRVDGGDAQPSSSDTEVGTGFYYTADKSLSESYYAVINGHNNRCGATLRTIVLTCGTPALRLAPRTIHTGQSMTLSNINPDQAAELSFFSLDGKMLQTLTVEGKDSYTFRPTSNAGIYLLRVRNGDNEQSFKYIVTK